MLPGEVMRFAHQLGLAIAFMLLTACASSPPPPLDARMCAPITAGPDVEEVRQRELRGAAVNVEGWAIAEARGFFAPEWVSVQPDGSVTRLETVLGGFLEGRSRAWASSFTLTELDIRVACDSAVVIGLAEARPLGAPQSSPPVRMRFINVWRKQDGRWLYAANQWTPAR
jgi:hypothetical protein